MSATTISELIKQADDFLDAGRLLEAKELFSKVCDLDENHTEAWMMKGVINGELGDIDEAEICLRKSINIDSNYADSYYFMATILVQKKDAKQAYEFCQKAVELDADFNEAKSLLSTLSSQLGDQVNSTGSAYQKFVNQGQALYHQGKYAEALNSLHAALDIDASLIDVWRICGEIYVQMKQFDDAAKAFLKAIEYAPDNAFLYNRLGQVYIQKGDKEAAERTFRQAIQSHSSYAESYNQLALLLMSENKIEDSINVYNDILSIDPKYAVAANNLGKIYVFHKNEPSKGMVYFNQAINADPSYAPAHQSLSNVLFNQGKLDEAIHSIQKAIDLKSDQAGYYNNLAAFLRFAGRLDESKEAFDNAIKCDPENTEALAGKADVFQRQQDYDKAYEVIRGLLDRGIRSTNIAIVLANVCRQYDVCDEAIALILKILSEDDIAPDGQKPLRYSLGKLYDAKHEYPLAFEQYELANELETNVFSAKNHAVFTDGLKEVYSEGFESRIPGSDINTDRPVFILGMPRSGTSLVEQILASHPEVYGAGELDAIGRLTGKLSEQMSVDKPYPYCMPDLSPQAVESVTKEYLDQLTTIHPTATKVTDKMPQNFLHIGFIRTVFPNAKIIHCIRNPLDTCLSIYFQAFGKFHPYSSDLKNIAAFYADYDRLMNHWKNVLPDDSYMEVEYEALVQNLESNSRELLDYCDLEWSDSCLEFYKTKRVVATASYDQVRQPAYTKSINRWKNYEQELRPLIDELDSYGIKVDS